MCLGGVTGLFMVIPFFIWRMLQSAWKQKIWALPLWGFVMIPMVCALFIDPESRGMIIGIMGAWSFFVAAIAMIICYRDGRPLKQAP